MPPPPTPPNLPTRNNNPGDLRDTKTGSFRQFADPKQGYAALLNDLEAKQTGTTTTGLGPSSSVADFAKIYAPPGDNNTSAKYAADLANKMKVSPATQLKDLDLGKWADAVAGNEGFSANNNAPVPGYAPPTRPAFMDQQAAPQIPQAPKVGQGAAGEFSGNAVRAVASPLVRTGGLIESALDQTLGRVGNAVAGKGFVPTHTGQQAQKAADSIDANASDSLAGKAGSFVGTIAPFFMGAGEAETAGLLAGKFGEGLLPKAAGFLAKKAPTIARDAAIGTAQTGDAKSGILTGLAAGIPVGVGKSGVRAWEAGATPEARIVQSIKDTMPLKDKGVRIDALRDTLPSSSTGKGGVVRKGIFGTSEIQPTAEDVSRGTAAHPYIQGVKDPLSKIANVNQGIKDTSSKVDEFLDAKAAPGNFADMRDYMEANRPSTNLQKDPGAAEAYNRATQDALDTLYSTMKTSAKDTGNFGPVTSGKDIRQARIAIDQQISRELGENTFGTPQYKGIKAAEIDTRNLLNRMNEDMLRYPGQMENLNKMNNFIASAKGRGIDVDTANPEVRHELESKFGLNPSGEADAQILAQQHKTMSYLYDSRDNMIDNYQKMLGKNKVQEAVASNPVIKAGIGVAKKAIPFGIGAQL